MRKDIILSNKLTQRDLDLKAIDERDKLIEHFKNLYLKAMYDLDHAGVITFHDRELIGESVGVGRPFSSFTALGATYGFLPAELSNIRIGARTKKTGRIKQMLNKLEEIKRNG